MSDNIIHSVEKRLEQWAEWYSRGNGYHLGYPSCSLEYRLLTEGVVVRSTAPPQLPSHPAAEEMERLVKELGEQNRAIAIILRCHYFMQGSLRAKSNRLKKLDVSISHTHFKRYVDMGHQWLAARLSDRKRKSTFK